MAQETHLLENVRVVFEALWMLFLLNLEFAKSIFNWFLPPEPKDVKGDIVLITGAGHGIGREVAIRFAKLGAKIVCVDINPKGNEETIRLVKEQKGIAYGYECDVTNREAVNKLTEKVRKEVGDVAILINNAGVMPTKPILQQTERDIRLVVDLNVTANLWMIQAFLPAMLERNYGHIVFMSSMAGLGGQSNLVPYCGTKYAVRGIMEALAIELHTYPKDTSGINFTTVCPYMVNTGLCKKPRVRFQTLLKLLEPGDVADALIDAVRRNYPYIVIPSFFYYMNKYIFSLIPFSGYKFLYDFFDSGLDPED